jgi:hypothetical protein
MVHQSHRTLIPIQYPPHAVALGSIYTASLLLSFEQPPPAPSDTHASPHEIAAFLSKKGSWETKFRVQVEDIEGVFAFSALTGGSVPIFILRRYYTRYSRFNDPLGAKSVGQHVSEHAAVSISTSIAKEPTDFVPPTPTATIPAAPLAIVQT